MRLDLPGLQAFVSIADRGSFTAAAQHLNLSQTALSHRIRKLEEMLGVALFVRSTRRVVLTPLGADLLPKARKAMDDLEDSLRSVRSSAHKADAEIIVACLPTIASGVMPDVIATFRTKFPDVRLRIADNSAGEIQEKVASGHAHFGVTLQSAARAGLEFSPIVEEPFLLVQKRPPEASMASPAGKDVVAWDDLGQTPLVRVSAETGNRVLLDDALGARMANLNWLYEVQRVSTALALVQRGLASAILPALAYHGKDISDLLGRRMINPQVDRILGIVSREEHAFGDAALFLIELTREALLKAGTANAGDMQHGTR